MTQIPLKAENDQNILRTYKMTEIPHKPKK